MLEDVNLHQALKLNRFKIIVIFIFIFIIGFALGWSYGYPLGARAVITTGLEVLKNQDTWDTLKAGIAFLEEDAPPLGNARYYTHIKNQNLSFQIENSSGINQILKQCYP